MQNRKQKQTVVRIGVNIETGAKLSEAIGSVEELSTWHDDRTLTGEETRRKMRSKQCARSDSVNAGWSYLGGFLKEPTTARRQIGRIRTYLKTWLCSNTSS